MKYTGSASVAAPLVPLTAPSNGYAERLIGSIRRECLDHVIVLSEHHVLRVLGEYLDDYHYSRPQQSLGGNSPEPREVFRLAPTAAKVEKAFKEAESLKEKYQDAMKLIGEEIPI